MNSRTIQQLTNDRIYSRNIPSTGLTNPISFRPVITKYTHTVESLDTNITENDPGIFMVNKMFTPGDRKSPWVGYKNSIDVESILRDQLTSIGQDKKYVPNIIGDMYKVTISPQPQQDIADFPYLFKQPVFGPFNPVHNTELQFTFNNSSRLRR